MNLTERLEAEARAEGKLPDEKPRTNGGNGHGTDDPFKIANAIYPGDVLDWLGVQRDGRKILTCPACGATSGCDIVDGGWKCQHTSVCAALGKRGFRTNVDTVMELRNVDKIESVNLLAERFGFRGIRPKSQRQPHPDPEADAEPVERKSPLAYLEADDIFAALDPVPWVVAELYLASGRPTLIAGYSYSAKTVAMMSMLLAVASGRLVWGRYRVQRRGIVLHIDHEQGLRATRFRYQRLARWMGVDVDDLRGFLRVVTLPRDFYLSNPTAEDELLEACQGVEVCLIDSLRASVPDVDENDSIIRAHLDKLTRVSEKTGTTFVVIHHAGKGGADKDIRERSRGSSAIFDACGAVLQLDGKQNEDQSTTVSVQMAKAPADAAGGKIPAFFLHVNDVTSDDGQERWGLMCEHRTSEQVNPPVSPDEALEGIASDVLRIIEGEASRSKLAQLPFNGVSGNFIRGMYRGKDSKLISPALERLESTGRIVSKKRVGRGGGTCWAIPATEKNDD